MQQHTPGPWKAKHLATYQEPGWVVLWPDKGSTHMRRLDYKGSFTEADARLIAVAPELLSELKAIVEGFTGTEYEHVFDDARALLAKAMGV